MTAPTIKLHDWGWEVYLPLAPVPAARHRVSGRGTYYPPKYETFRRESLDLLSSIGGMGRPSTNEMEAECLFVCTKPKNPTNPYPRGDIDNYVKAIFDSITKAKIIWEDDVQVVKVDAVKRYQEKNEEPCIKLWIRHNT